MAKRAWWCKAAVLLGAVCALALLSGLVTGLISCDRNGNAADSATAQPSGNAQQATITKITDGDTVWVQPAAGEKFKVRLIGIDTPECVSSNADENVPEGTLASEHANELLSVGQTVWLTADADDADQYGRALRYLWLEAPSANPNEDEICAKMFNAIMVADGYARVEMYSPNDSLEPLFTRLFEEAQAEGRGISYYFESDSLDNG